MQRMDSLRIRIYGAFLYDCGVYSCLSSRFVVGPVKVLLGTSGGAWCDNDDVSGDGLELWVVLLAMPGIRAWVPANHYQGNN
jgi:hypothetical protein